MIQDPKYVIAIYPAKKCNYNNIDSRYKTHEESRAERRNYFTEKEIPIDAPVAPPRVIRIELTQMSPS
jgi:hypothetical protein